MKKLYILLLLLSFLGVQGLSAQGSWTLTGTQEMCLGEDATFLLTIDPGSGVDAVSYITWDYGDSKTDTDNVSAGMTNVTKTHNYKLRGTYHMIATPFRADDTPITENIRLTTVKVNSCGIPVNHITSIQDYGITIPPCPKPKTPVIAFDPPLVEKEIGDLFTATVTAASIDASATYTWSIANSATNGLTIDGTNTGTSITIKGSKSGAFDAADIIVTATNTCGFTQGFGLGTITIKTKVCTNPDPVITFNKTTVWMDNNDKSFNATVAVTDATGVTFEWSISQAGLDAGLSIDSSTPAIGSTTIKINCSKGGVIPGNVISVKATNACGTVTAYGPGSITVDCTMPSISIGFDKMTIDKDKGEYITATTVGTPGTNATYTWTILQAGLDAGLYIESTSGDMAIIKGTKTTTISAGYISVTVTNVCGSATFYGSGNITVTCSVVPSPTIKFTPAMPFTSNLNGTFTAEITTVEAGVTYEWSTTDIGSQAGLVITSSTIGENITIRCTKAGLVNGNYVVLKATNTCGTITVTGLVNISVLNCEEVPTIPTIRFIPDPVEIMDTESFTVIAEGATGATSYIWTVPSGLTITEGNTTATIKVVGVAGKYDGTGIKVIARNDCGNTPQVVGSGDIIIRKYGKCTTTYVIVDGVYKGPNPATLDQAIGKASSNNYTKVSGQNLCVYHTDITPSSGKNSWTAGDEECGKLGSGWRLPYWLEFKTLVANQTLWSSWGGSYTTRNYWTQTVTSNNSNNAYEIMYNKNTSGNWEAGISSIPKSNSVQRIRCVKPVDKF